jgi:3-oxoacyl-[acyl-carrier protein] reductase
LISVGGPPTGSVSSTTDEQWTSSFAAVFLGAVRTAREVAARLGPDGSIAFILSTSVKGPLTEMAVSNGLRPGLAMIAKQLADELGPRGIRVNGLLPGRVATERLSELDALQDDPVAAKASAAAGIPLRRDGAPSEFGRAAAFLLSPAASFVSGAMLPVDGGVMRAL